MEKEELSVTSMCAENLYLTLNLYMKDAINKYILIQNFSHKMKLTKVIAKIWAMYP